MATPEKLPEGTLVSAEFSFTLPCAAETNEVREWLEFELGCRCEMSGENPLRNYDVPGLGLEFSSMSEPN